MEVVTEKRGRGRPRGLVSTKPRPKPSYEPKKHAMKEYQRIETLADKCLSEGSVLRLTDLVGNFVGTVTEKREFLLKYTSRLTMMGYTGVEIATLFDVTPETVSNWRREIKERSKKRVEQYDQLSFVSETLDFYDEVKETSLRLANSSNVSVKEKLNAINAAVGAENGKQSFLRNIGFLGNIKMTPAAPEDSDTSHKFRLLGSAKEIFDEENIVE